MPRRDQTATLLILFHPGDKGKLAFLCFRADCRGKGENPEGGGEFFGFLLQWLVPTLCAAGVDTENAPKRSEGEGPGGKEEGMDLHRGVIGQKPDEDDNQRI